MMLPTLSKRISYFTLFLFLLISTCRKDEVEISNEQPFILQKTDFSAFFNLTGNIANFNSNNLRVVSGFHEGSIQLIQTSSQHISGSLSIELVTNSVQLLMITDGETPIAYALVDPSQMEESFTVNARTTSTALLLMSPIMIDLYNSNTVIELMNAVEGLSSFSVLSSEAENFIASKNIEGILSTNAYRTTLTEMVGAIFDSEYEGSQALRVGKIIDDPFRIEAINGRKRWVSLYAESRQVTAAQEYTERRIRVTTENEWNERYLLPSPSFRESFRVELFESIFGGIEIDFEFATLWDTRAVNLEIEAPETDDQFKITAYGPGIIEDGYELTPDDEERLIEVYAYTIINDLVAPTVELMYGLRDQGKSFRGELRGRPKNNKVKTLFVRMTQELLKASIKETLLAAIQNRDTRGIFDVLKDASANFLSDIENDRLIKNMLREFYSTESSLYAVQEILPAIRALGLYVDVLETGLDAVNGFLSIIFSDAIQEFSFDRRADGDFIIYPVEPVSGDLGQLAINVAVSDQGEGVWMTNGWDIYKLDQEEDRFIRKGLYEELFFDDDNPIVLPLIINRLDINPISQDPYFCLTGVVGSVTGFKSQIYRYHDGELELVYEPNSPETLIHTLDFDPHGNLWFWVISDGSDINGMYRIDPSGQLQVYAELANGVEPTLGNTAIVLDLFSPDVHFSASGNPIILDGSGSNINNNKFFELTANGELYPLMADSLITSLEALTYPESLDLLNCFAPTATDLYFPAFTSNELRPKLIHFNRNTEVFTLTEEFAGIESEYYNIPINFYKEPAPNRLWFSLANHPQVVLYNEVSSSGLVINKKDQNNSNLPASPDPDNLYLMYDIDGNQTVGTWIAYGKYVLKVEF